MKVSYILLLVCYFSFSQNKSVFKSNNGFSYGVSGKINVDLKPIKPVIKLSLVAGVGYNFDEVNLFPSTHAGVLIFNTGAIGSRLDKPKTNVTSHLFGNFIMTLGLDKRNYSYVERYVPFYHFADFAANPIQNPYKSSVSLGKNWVLLSKGINQKLGFLNINVIGRAQISYYNDGGFLLEKLGDKLDRYYTGGVLFSYHGNLNDTFDLVELSFHKHTGYVKHAFDVADKFQLDFVTYKDSNQLAYNNQRWKFSMGNISSGLSFHFSIYDANSLDLQDFIHFKTNVPYHPDYNRIWQFAYGMRYENNYNEQR